MAKKQAKPKALKQVKKSPLSKKVSKPIKPKAKVSKKAKARKAVKPISKKVQAEANVIADKLVTAFDSLGKLIDSLNAEKVQRILKFQSKVADNLKRA